MLTEQELIERIQTFASEISSQPLCQAYHQPEDGARPLCCFENVWVKVWKTGGDILFGWTFCHRVNPQYGEYLLATHHAVWRASDNTLIDVTPLTDDPKHHPRMLGDYVLFLVDEEAQPVENGSLIAPLPLKYFALDDSQSLKGYVDKLVEQEREACREILAGNINPDHVSWISLKR